MKIQRIWDCEIIHQKPSLFRFIVQFIRYFPTSLQRAFYAPDVSKIQGLVLFSLIRTCSYKIHTQHVIVDLADIISITFSRIAKKSPLHIFLLRKIESFLLRFDEAKVASKYFNCIVSFPEYRLAKMREWKTFLLRQPAPISLEKLDIQHCSLEKKNQIILFIGPNSYYPNHEALLWLSTALSPVLPTDWKIHWAGHNYTGKNYHGISSLGFVENIQKLITQCALTVVPIFTNTGVQNKILDAIYLGACVITFKRLSRFAFLNPPENLISCSSKTDMLKKILDFTHTFQKRSQNNSVNEVGFDKFHETFKTILNECFNN